MNNLSLTLNLSNLKGSGVAELTGKTGKKRCLVIPIDDASLFMGSKGVYLNLIAWSSDKLTNERTHLIKQSFSKEQLEKMSEDEKKNLPILGDVKTIGIQSQVATSEYSDFNSEEEKPF